jgi:hypothetical protein
MELDKHIRMYDPAIDWSDGATPKEWLVSRDHKLLVLKPGKTPVAFYCARLTRSAVRWVHESASEPERLFRCFRAGVRRVEHPDRVWTPQGVSERGYVAMTEDEADQYGIADHYEIGGLVYERSILPTDCEGGYTLRPTSLLVLDAALRASLHAASSPDERTPTASEPEGS